MMREVRPRRRERLIVGISGASGAIYGLALLRALQGIGDVETHLILSASGALTVAQELDMRRGELEALADVTHHPRDVGASVASGSFATLGMVIAPCSMKTLASIANGLSDNLMSRAADVVLKERRRLVLLARETPLNLAHLRNMTRATEMGAIVMPPVPAFYTRPRDIDDIVAHTIGRVLDLFSLEHEVLADASRWGGMKAASADKDA